MEVDDVAYTRELCDQGLQIRDARELPKDTARRYMANYNYHIASLYYLCDHDTVEKMFANSTDTGTQVDAILLAQFNMLMALGKRLENGKTNGEKSGEAYCEFALSLLRDKNESFLLARSPVILAQCYALMGLFHQSLNMRNDAYLFVRCLFLNLAVC